MKTSGRHICEYSVSFGVISLIDIHSENAEATTWTTCLSIFINAATATAAYLSFILKSVKYPGRGLKTRKKWKQKLEWPEVQFFSCTSKTFTNQNRIEMLDDNRHLQPLKEIRPGYYYYYFALRSINAEG